MYCSHCGRELPAEARFCGACGTPVSGGSPPPAGWQPAAAVAVSGTGHASFWLRFAGWIVDVIVTSVGSAMLGIAIGILYLAATAGESDGAALGNGTQLLSFLVGFCYKWLLDSNGGTIGKMAVGIRVVDDVTLQPIDYARGLGRTLMSMVSGLALGLGFLWAAWDSRGKTWHDHVAGSIVVKRA